MPTTITPGPLPDNVPSAAREAHGWSLFNRLWLRAPAHHRRKHMIRKGWDWGRNTANAVTAAVAAIAGYVSYGHLVDYAVSVGEKEDRAALVPFGIDGMILIGTLQMRADRKAGRAPRTWAYIAILVGVVSTIAGNIASAQPTLGGRLVAASTPASFLIAVEVLWGGEGTIRGWLRKVFRRQPKAKDSGSVATVPVATVGAATAAQQAELVAALPIAGPDARRRANTRTGSPDRVSSPVPATVEPAPVEPDVAPNPQPDTTPEQPAAPNPQPQKPQTKVVDRRKTSRPMRPETLAAAEAVAEPDEDGTIRDGQGRAVGTKTRPMREVDVDGARRVLDTLALQAHARGIATAMLQDPSWWDGGQVRKGIGAEVARRYNPPMSARWGQERATEALAEMTASGDVSAAPVVVPDDPEGVVDGGGEEEPVGPLREPATV
jgi:hypothetical protein